MYEFFFHNIFLKLLPTGNMKTKYQVRHSLIHPKICSHPIICIRGIQMGGSFDPIQVSLAYFQGFHSNIFDWGWGGRGMILTFVTSNLKFFKLFLAIFMLIPDVSSKLLKFKQYSSDYAVFFCRDTCTNKVVRVTWYKYLMP